MTAWLIVLCLTCFDLGPNETAADYAKVCGPPAVLGPYQLGEPNAQGAH